MLASHEWLRGFVPHSLAPADVERLISTHVATVDSVKALRADLASFVVARVTWADRHPDSDHLWVTKVDDGSGALLDVVCGAPNVSVGTLYPFARTGTVMPNGMRIERRRIRGETSNGMLCSARELGLGEDHQGILALTVDVPPGTPLLEAMPIGDVCYEIDVLPNRPDLLCHIGMARELSALTSVGLKAPPELADLSASAVVVSGSGSTTVGGVPVTIEDTEGCPRYAAAVIRGVKVGPSPAWLRERLESIGQRSISNVVDVTNYFLHAFGQPMHAFDLARVQGPAIIVRRARAGEQLTTLDGVDRALDGEMLVIADASHATGIAGVIGGAGSEVTDSTTDILLEVASFDPRSVRRTRRALNISTDASHRFERGTDPNAPLETVGLAAQLIVTLGGGAIDGAPVLVGRGAAPRSAVSVDVQRMARLLGAAVNERDIISMLGAIGFDVRPASPGILSVIPPSWRHDVARDVDVLEEIARLRGYDALPDTLSAFRPTSSTDHPLHAPARRVRHALVAAGFAELRPLPFVAGDDATHVRVTNPLADDEPHLRTSVIDTLVKRAQYNLSRREGNLRLFEIGSVWQGTAGTMREECRVGALLMGAAAPVHFTRPEPAVFDAWDAKALATEIAGAAFSRAVTLVGGEDAVLWRIEVGGERRGEVRALAFDAPPWASPAFGIELTIGELSAANVAPPGAHAHDDARSGEPVQVRRYRPLPAMPAAEFDLAFLVPDGVAAARVEETLRTTGGDLLERIVLFDEFRGTGVPAGQRSLAWRLTFRHPERTLNDKEISGRRQKLIATVEKEHGLVARTG